MAKKWEPSILMNGKPIETHTRFLVKIEPDIKNTEWNKI